MTKTTAHHNRATPLVRRPHPTRDLIEGVLTALVLALIIRHYVFEVFQIPTGSMAPTLLGQHRDLHCPQCGLRFPVDASVTRDGVPKVINAVCPNCRYQFYEDEVRRTFCTCFPAKPQALFYRGSNRVIANKFLNRFHPPKRWEVVVFKYPRADIVCKDCGSITRDVNAKVVDHCQDCGSRHIRIKRKNYIKRVVGLPGESIEIRHGNIYTDGKIQRKPTIVQEDLWQIVHDSAFQPKVPRSELPPRWIADSGSFILNRETGEFELLPDETGKVTLRYGRAIRNFHAYNDLGRNSDRDIKDAADLRWRIKAKLQEAGRLILELAEDDVRYRAEVNFGANGNEGTVLKENGRVIASTAFSANIDLEHEVAFSHVDDQLALVVDGTVILSHEYDIPPENVPPDTRSSAASFGIEGTEARLTNVVLERDIYYTRKGMDFKYAPTCQIPKDSYFVLGDNSRNSQDSRYWGFVPTQNLIGEAVVVWWPLSHLKPVR